MNVSRDTYFDVLSQMGRNLFQIHFGTIASVHFVNTIVRARSRYVNFIFGRRKILDETGDCIATIIQCMQQHNKRNHMEFHSGKIKK